MTKYTFNAYDLISNLIFESDGGYRSFQVDFKKGQN